MRLDQALFLRGLCDSRTEASILIKKGAVKVNGIFVNKPSKQIKEEDEIICTDKRKYVSRGGEKLEGALIHILKSDDKIINFLKNKQAIDIGSSTGGFTHCLLDYGVDSVLCVDVGSNQLHEIIRKNPKVEVFENVDIRNFKTKYLFDIVVADLSFISLDKVIEKILTFGKKESLYILLLKPQFEVGKNNTKKGIVKNEKLVKDILDKYRKFLNEQKINNLDIFSSQIKGGDGNQEYFITFSI